jgi:hypothetical protein
MAAGMKYRQERPGTTYHWCVNCSGWPTANYRQYDYPPSGTACKECQSISQSSNCATLVQGRTPKSQASAE